MKYTDEEWEYIVGDTWHHNKYYDLMVSILKDENDNWIEEFKLTENELRDMFLKIERYWKNIVGMLLWQGEEE